MSLHTGVRGPGHMSRTVGAGGPDTTPDAFSFTDQTNATTGLVYESNTIVVAGLGVGQTAAMTITGGTYSKNGAAYASGATTVTNGDTVKVKGPASGSYSTAVDVVLTIGGVSDTYTITTQAAPANLEPSAIEILGGSITDNTHSMLVDGMAARMTFKGMTTRIGGSVSGGNFAQVNGLDATKIVLTVTDAGYDTSGNAQTVTRTITGTLALGKSYPTALTATPETITAGDFRSNGAGKLYFALSGGSYNGTVPSHASGSNNASGVDWTFVDVGTYAPGFVQATSGSDVLLTFALDDVIYPTTTIVSCAVTAGAWNDGTHTSIARTMGAVEITNNSTLARPATIVGVVTPPHLRSTGSFDFEITAFHYSAMRATTNQSVACVKMRAWDASRSTSSPLVTVSAPSLSSIVTTGGVAGLPLEVWRGTLDTSGIGAGAAFIEYQVYPWIGAAWDSRTDGEAADWQASTAYADVRMLVRNGVNLYQLATAGTSASSGGPTGTGSSISDGTAVWNFYGSDLTIQNSPNPQARHHFYNDPSDAYRLAWANVKTTGTCVATTEGGGSKVYASRAAALAAASTDGNCYASAKLAQDAIIDYNNNHTGDGKTAHNDGGGGTILVQDGTYPAGFMSASMNATNRPQVWLTIEAVNPGSVDFSAVGTSKVPPKRSWWKGFSLNAATVGANTYIDAAGDGSTTLTQSTWETVFERWTYTGNSTASNSLVTRTGLVWFLNSTFVTKFAWGDSDTRESCAWMGGCLANMASGNLQANVANLYSNNFHGSAIFIDPRNRYRPAMMFYIHQDNSFRQAGTSGILVKAFAGDSSRPNPVKGAVWTGNLFEIQSDAGASKCAQIGADSTTSDMSNVLFIHNTNVGERFNTGYNDPGAKPSHPIRQHWLRINNVFTEPNQVGGYHTHPTATDYPDGNLHQNLWLQYALGDRRNFAINGGPHGPGTNCFREGAGSVWNLDNADTANPANTFISDKSDLGAGGGDGDYRPYEGGGCAFIALATTSPRKYDLAGASRRTNGTGSVGAYERA